MIEGSKQQQLTFDKGITNVPSDLLCSDNALEESVGMIYDNGEHRVIQKPNEYITSAQTTAGTQMDVPVILYIHKLNNLERYIGHIPSGEQRQLCWGIVENKVFKLKGMFMKGQAALYYTNETKVTSIGKTLIIYDNEGGHYYLWKEDEINLYHPLGKMPEQQVEFWLWNKAKPQGIMGGNRSGEFVKNTLKADGIIDGGGRVPVIVEGEQESYNDIAIALYSKNKKAVAGKKGFCLPFLIRTALEMYDGSYTHISQPILMFPSITRNSTFGFGDNVIDCTTHYLFLKYKDTSNFSGWEDVIKHVAIFISDGIEIYNLTVDQTIKGFNTGEEASCDYVSRISKRTDPSANESISVYSEMIETSDLSFKGLTEREYQDIFDDIVSTSIFYKLCDIGLNTSGTGTEEWINSRFDPKVLQNIETQETLSSDDFFSRSQILPQFLYTYNNRLNMANLSRSFFDGFDFFMPNDNNEPHNYDFYVTIETNSGERVVQHSKTNCYQKQGIYFYYPDSRAKKVVIIKDSNECVLSTKLKEHKGLNGSYFFAPESIEDYEGIELHELFKEKAVVGYTIPEEKNQPEILENYIITSEVNNPWVFSAEGYNSVGTGKIIGMSTITQALSQGQFGEYPLLVFSESGVWAMSVNSTGLFQTIHPMSREVCNNANSITQTDGAVFFSSEKGLMVVVGGDVRCVSEQLSGRNADFTGEISMGNFRDYLKDCFIAYDYRDSLLWIFNNSRQQNNKYCYVYSIKSGTFGKFSFVAPITNVVNNYPDYLLQTGSRVYSLTERVNINLDPDEYDGLIITRPMKLENGLALKSLMQVRHIKQMQGNMTLRIFASNNTEHWVELHSLRGTPWKYYRFRYDFTNLVATDRFAGSVVITKERRTDKLL